MERSDLTERIELVENEIQKLKAAQARSQPRSPLHAAARFLIENWVLLSFVFALLTAIYVKFAYHVDYLESYRNTSDNKKLSEFYVRLGDNMMAVTNWDAAADAYESALKLNPNNQAATYGLVKARVFQPLPGAKEIDPEIVDTRLDYLLKHRDLKDDYQVFLMKSYRLLQMGDASQARSWIEKCIDKAPQFASCYFVRGYIGVSEGQIEKAAADFAKVLEYDPNSSVARNNLAACNMILARFDRAADLFSDSNRIDPTALNARNLAEASWFTGRFQSALIAHSWAADRVDRITDPNERFLAGLWMEPFLPLRPGDTETSKTKIFISTLDQKKAVLHYELAIDHALLGQLSAADKEFAAARKIDREPDIVNDMDNRIQSIESFVTLSPATRSWLDAHRH